MLTAVFDMLFAGMGAKIILVLNKMVTKLSNVFKAETVMFCIIAIFGVIYAVKKQEVL